MRDAPILHTFCIARVLDCQCYLRSPLWCMPSSPVVSSGRHSCVLRSPAFCVLLRSAFFLVSPAFCVTLRSAFSCVLLRSYPAFRCVLAFAFSAFYNPVSHSILRSPAFAFPAFCAPCVLASCVLLRPAFSVLCVLLRSHNLAHAHRISQFVLSRHASAADLPSSEASASGGRFLSYWVDTGQCPSIASITPSAGRLPRISARSALAILINCSVLAMGGLIFP